MITLISFVLVVFGCVNWLIIGLMQYDFVAGIFGTQSSLLSRIVYIFVGFAGIWLILMSFIQKGKIKINDNGFKRLNKALPAPEANLKSTNNSEHTQHHANNNQNFNNSTQLAHQQTQFKPQPPPPHPSNIDAGEEFYHNHSQNSKNPFD